MARRVEVTAQDVAAAAKMEAAAVPFKTLVEEFGEKSLTFDADGNYNFHLEGREQVERFEEMDRERSEIEAGVGAAQSPDAVLRTADGRERAVPEHLAEMMAKSPNGKKLGLRERPRWGRPAYRLRYRNGQLVETRLR